MKSDLIHKIWSRSITLFGKILYKDNLYWDRRWGKGEYGKPKYNDDDYLLIDQIKLFRSLNISSVFDYGGGDGHSLKAHIDSGYLDRFGYGEISDVAIDMARKVLPDQCRIYDLKKKEKVAEKYELVYTRAVIICVNPKSIEKVYNDILKMEPKYIFMQEAYYYPEPKGANFNHEPWIFFFNHNYQIEWMKYQIIVRKDGSIRHPGQGYDLLLMRNTDLRG